MRRYAGACRARNLQAAIAADLVDSTIRPQQTRKRGVSFLFSSLEDAFAALLTELGISDLAELSIAETNRLWDKAETTWTANIADWEAQLGWDA